MKRNQEISNNGIHVFIMLPLKYRIPLFHKITRYFMNYLADLVQVYKAYFREAVIL